MSRRLQKLNRESYNFNKLYLGTELDSIGNNTFLIMQTYQFDITENISKKDAALALMEFSIAMTNDYGVEKRCLNEVFRCEVCFDVDTPLPRILKTDVRKKHICNGCKCNYRMLSGKGPVHYISWAQERFETFSERKIANERRKLNKIYACKKSKHDNGMKPKHKAVKMKQGKVRRLKHDETRNAQLQAAQTGIAQVMKVTQMGELIVETA